MQVQGSSQVSPQSAHPGAEAEVCFAGVAQSVEHLFCKQVVGGSSPFVSSFGAPARASVFGSKVSESCPSGQREQAVNLPAYAYAGSNPALSTSAPRRGAAVSVLCLGSSAPPRRSELGGAPLGSLGFGPKRSAGEQSGTGERTAGTKRSRARSLRPVSRLAGVAQLVERQPSKLNVEGSNPFSRSTAPSHRFVTSVPAHLAQLVEHVLGKDEVTSSILVVGSKQK
jgi:hypothetical protein